MKSKNKIVGDHLHIAFRDNSVMKPPFCENYLKLWRILNLLSIFDKKWKMHLWILKDYAEIFFKIVAEYVFFFFCLLLNLVSVLANIFINFGENRYL